MAQHECTGLEATAASLAKMMWFSEHKRYPGVSDAEAFLALVGQCRKALIGEPSTAGMVLRKR